MKTREQNEHNIKQLFWGTPIGDELVMRLVYEFGLSAFTDEAIARLAQLHRAFEDREITRALRKIGR